MDNSKKKEPWMEKNKILGFTLIELIAVLVILAVLALIVTPLVLGIIKKAKESARKRSIDGYGHAVELAVAKYMMHNGSAPYELTDLTVQYAGSEVKCSVMEINPDSSIYLSGCTVDNKAVNYSYGEDMLPDYREYHFGDTITYNGMMFHVVKNSSAKKEYVTLLKDNPLTYEEVNQYKDSLSINVYNSNGYGGVYYGSNADFKSSNVKLILDSWKKTAFNSGDYLDVRLIKINELIDNYGYRSESVSGTLQLIRGDNTPNYVYNSNYTYWTMSQFEDGSTYLYAVPSYTTLTKCGASSCNSYVIRPVVILKKSAIGG